MLGFALARPEISHYMSLCAAYPQPRLALARGLDVPNNADDVGPLSKAAGEKDDSRKGEEEKRRNGKWVRPLMDTHTIVTGIDDALQSLFRFGAT